jgi:hypothetical protein
MSDSDSEGEFGIFQEPEGFYEPDKEPSFVDYTLQSGLKLNLRLVGHNPLWVSFSTAYSLPTRTLLYCWSPSKPNRWVLHTPSHVEGYCCMAVGQVLD